MLDQPVEYRALFYSVVDNFIVSPEIMQFLSQQINSYQKVNLKWLC